MKMLRPGLTAFLLFAALNVHAADLKDQAAFTDKLQNTFKMARVLDRSDYDVKELKFLKVDVPTTKIFGDFDGDGLKDAVFLIDHQQHFKLVFVPGGHEKAALVTEISDSHKCSASFDLEFHPRDTLVESSLDKVPRSKSKDIFELVYWESSAIAYVFNGKTFKKYWTSD